MQWNGRVCTPEELFCPLDDKSHGTEKQRLSLLYLEHGIYHQIENLFFYIDKYHC